MHQETPSNFLGIFCKKTRVHRGSDSKNKGVHSKNSRKKIKENQAHGYEAQTHATWWIRISRMPQRRWINPDPIIPRSNGQRRRKVGSGLDRPGPARLYKRIWPGSGHFFLSFLFLLSPVSLLLSSSPTNPNPNPT